MTADSAPTPAAQAPVLEVAGLGKRFGTVQVLNDVRLTLRAGEIHALMGQNGAGKSTLIKIVTGVFGADAGEIRLAGRAVQPNSPLAAQRLGAMNLEHMNRTGELPGRAELVPHIPSIPALERSGERQPLNLEMPWGGSYALEGSPAEVSRFDQDLRKARIKFGGTGRG